MRFVPFVLAFLLIASVALGAFGVTADHGEPHGPPDNPGQGQSQGNATEPDGNETADPNGNETAPPKARGPPEHARAHRIAWERTQDPERPTGPGWGAAMREAMRDPAAQKHAEELAHLPENARAHAGLFTAENGTFTGRFVSLEVDPEWGALHNVSVAGILLFESVYFPAEENITLRNRGQTLEIAGETWRFHVVDAPAAPMHFGARGPAIQLVLANHTTLIPHENRLQFEFDGSDLTGRLVGDAALDAAATNLVTVTDATFHVAANVVVAESRAAVPEPGVAMQEARERRAMGGEVALFAARPDAPPGKAVVGSVTPYEDVEIEVASGVPVGEVPQNATVHTIFVTAHDLPGKSFVIHIEPGLIDLDALTLRYYTIVEGNATLESIVMAESLEDALDPTTGVAKYWIQSTEEGVQLVFSVPHFSTHALELLSFLPEIVVKVVLTLGVIGALVVVALGTASLFRRPEHTL